jgi:TrmH family RNA methyltransferase
VDAQPAITSRTNPLVKLTRSLRSRKERSRTRLFLAEGILHVGEAVEAGWQVEAILYAPGRLESDYARKLIDEQAQRGVRCQPVTDEVFESIAEKDNPQGILAVVHQKTWALSELPPPTFFFGAAVVAPQDPGNVGTILRTLDAVGADGLILLDGGVDPFHPTAVRASMGALFWKRTIQASFANFKSWAHAGGYRLIGTSAHGSIDYRAFELDERPSILVLGSEQKGLTPAQIAACEVIIKLPMRGRASSLNLAVAAGILLYSLRDQ